MKKKVKHRLTGKKLKPDGTGINLGGEETDSMSLLLRPEPHVVEGESYDGEGDRTDAGRGGDDDQQEASQKNLRPYPDVKAVVGRGPGGELAGVCPSPPTLSISHRGKPESTRTRFLQLPLLIIPSGDVDISAPPDYGPEAVRPDEALEPNAAVDKKELNPKSTMSATAKLLHEVGNSASAFSPLKSIARSLGLILDNCEVWAPLRPFDPQHLRSF